MSDIYDLDFENIQEKIKDFISSKEEFKDYNFEGSVLSSQMDIFAFATMYMGYYLNMSFSEMFLQSSELPENVYAHSSGTLNYLPNRKTAARVKVNFKRKEGNFTQVNIPKYTKFAINGADLVLLEDLVIDDNSDHEVYLYQGFMVTDEFYSTKEISDSTTFESFELTYTSNVDNKIFYVYVDKYLGNDTWDVNGIEWERVQEYPTVGEKRFYIDYGESMSVKFDSGAIYQYPVSNDRIRVMYLKTDGSDHNGYAADIVPGDNRLSLNESINENIDIIRLTALKDGADEDSLAKIKAVAPQYFVTQNRAVTENDYNTLIKTWDEYESLHSAKAWGGDKEYIDSNNKILNFNDNPTANKDLGHVYITAVNTDFTRLDSDKVQRMIDFYDDKHILTIFLKYINPNIVVIKPDISIRKKKIFGISENDIRNGIVEYLEAMIGQGMSFHRSNFLRAVDSITGVDYSDVSFTTYVNVINNNNNVIRLFNQVVPNSVTGTVNSLTLADDGAGTMLFDSNPVGTINYDDGFISLDTSAEVNFIAEGEEFNLDFAYTNSHTFTLEKETFLDYNGAFTVSFDTI